MKSRRIPAKELKVHTGEVLGRVAEGAVVYVTHRGKSIARIEPVCEPHAPAEVRRMVRLIAELPKKWSGALGSSAEFSRAKEREEKPASRRRG